jgi:hypothetical protein
VHSISNNILVFQLLAEAETLICNSSANEGNTVFMMDYKDTDIVDSPEEPASDTTLPDWVKSLEPVRKLPTNVGTRIRKCVYEALERKPPEWARKILEHSISKEVYKGNASGPTKVCKVPAGTNYKARKKFLLCAVPYILQLIIFCNIGQSI